MGPLIIDVAAHTLSPEDKILLKESLVGGVILFSRNYSNPKQVRALIAEIRHANPNLFICVDQEGGRVQRFKEGLTLLPPPGTIRLNPTIDTERFAENLGWLMSAEMRALDVDFSFAPVLDIDYGICPIVGDRAFGTDAHTVSTLAMAYVRGMHQNGMKAVGKHFPGHGGVITDSHLTIPYDRRSMLALEEDLKPFENLIRAGLDAIMPAHIVYEAIDTLPASFSPFWMQQVLRQKMNFNGVIVCDDICMNAAAMTFGSVSARFEKALAAGCDLIPVCNSREAVLEIVRDFAHHNFAPNPAVQKLRAEGNAISLEELQNHPRRLATLQAIAHHVTQEG